MSARSEGWLGDALPVALQEDRLMSQFVALIENISEDIQSHIDEFRLIADSSVVPTDLLNWLGSFVDAPVTGALQEVDRRHLLASLGKNLRRRSTKEHLEVVISAFIEGEFEVIDGGGVYHSGPSEEAISQVIVRIAEEPRGGFEAFESALRSIVPAHCLLDLQMMEGG